MKAAAEEKSTFSSIPNTVQYEAQQTEFQPSFSNSLLQLLF